MPDQWSPHRAGMVGVQEEQMEAYRPLENLSAREDGKTYGPSLCGLPEP